MGWGGTAGTLRAHPHQPRVGDPVVTFCWAPASQPEGTVWGTAGTLWGRPVLMGGGAQRGAELTQRLTPPLFSSLPRPPPIHPAVQSALTEGSGDSTAARSRCAPRSREAPPGRNKNPEKKEKKKGEKEKKTPHKQTNKTHQQNATSRKYLKTLILCRCC